MVKICVISISAKKIFFVKNYLFYSSKEVFLHNLRQFLEHWIFEGISTGADLIKMVKICNISICSKKIFFVKIICSTHQRKCFSTNLGNFWKFDFLKEYRQARTLQKWWKFVLSQFVLRNIFCQNYLFHSSKEVFLHNFRQIFENWIFEGISTGADLTKMVKNWTILKCVKKIFFVKIIFSTHQRKCFSTILGNFWKIDILKEYRQARTLQKMVKISFISICAKKFFFVKIICSTHQRKCFSTILGNLENWIFEGISTGADLTKMVKICIISICAKKIFFVKIICSIHQRKCFSTILGNIWKFDFLKEYWQARTLQKW